MFLCNSAMTRELFQDIGEKDFNNFFCVQEFKSTSVAFLERACHWDLPCSVKPHLEIINPWHITGPTHAVLWLRLVTKRYYWAVYCSYLCTGAKLVLHSSVINCNILTWVLRKFTLLCLQQEEFYWKQVNDLFTLRPSTELVIMPCLRTE